jgi:proteic killer suppression protein
MIKSFKHRGLEQFFKDGNKKGINPEHTKRIARILDRLDASTNPKDMNLPGYKLHKLSGQSKDVYSVWVSGNWRITFKFKGEDAIMVDYKDYH